MLIVLYVHYPQDEPAPMEQPPIQDPYAAVSQMDYVQAEPECIK